MNFTNSDSDLDFIRPIYRELTVPGKEKNIQKDTEEEDEAIWCMGVTTSSLVWLMMEGVGRIFLAQNFDALLQQTLGQLLLV